MYIDRSIQGSVSGATLRAIRYLYLYIINLSFCAYLGLLVLGYS